MPTKGQQPSPTCAAQRSAPWLAALLGILVFLPTLGNQFAYDDIPLVASNPNIRDPGNWHAIWLSDWWNFPRDDGSPAQPGRDRLYRPLTLFTFALNYAVGGLNPVGFHLVNVALHAIATMLVWNLARRWFDGAIAAAAAALVFAVHPVHVEAVAQVVGRGEILASIFLMLGLMALFPKWNDNDALDAPTLNSTLLAAAAFLAALLSKETAVCIVLIAPLMFLWRDNLRRATIRQAVLTMLAIALPLATYLPLRYLALEHHLLRSQPPSEVFNPLFDATAGERVSGALTVLGHYARLFLAPTRLSCDYGLAVINPAAGADALTALGAAAAGFGLFGLTWVRSKHPQRRAVGWLLALFIASYLLISNTALLIGVTVAERLAYWPSVFVALLVGVLVDWVARLYRESPGPQRLLRMAGVAAIAVLALRSTVRGLDWHDNLTLFSADLETHPRSVVLCAGVATELLKQAGAMPAGGERDEKVIAAEGFAERALALAPNEPRALACKATARLLAGEPAAAMPYLERLLKVDSQNVAVRHALEDIRRKQSP